MKNKIISLLCVFIITFSLIISSFFNPLEVKAVAIVDDAFYCIVIVSVVASMCVVASDSNINIVGVAQDVINAGGEALHALYETGVTVKDGAFEFTSDFYKAVKDSLNLVLAKYSSEKVYVSEINGLQCINIELGYYHTTSYFLADNKFYGDSFSLGDRDFRVVHSYSSSGADRFTLQQKKNDSSDYSDCVLSADYDVIGSNNSYKVSTNWDFNGTVGTVKDYGLVPYVDTLTGKTGMGIFYNNTKNPYEYYLYGNFELGKVEPISVTSDTVVPKVTDEDLEKVVGTISIPRYDTVDDVVANASTITATCVETGENIGNNNNGKEDKEFNFKPLYNLGTAFTQAFPFCLPFAFYEMIKCFEADPIAPVFEANIAPKSFEPFYIRLDFNNFEKLANIIRTLILIIYSVSLILITKKIIS